MVNITVSVPIEMKKRMEEFAVINWSEVARAAFESQIEKLELLKALTSESKATDEDIQKLSEKIKAAVWKRHEEKR